MEPHVPLQILGLMYRKLFLDMVGALAVKEAISTLDFEVIRSFEHYEAKMTDKNSEERMSSYHKQAQSSLEQIVENVIGKKWYVDQDNWSSITLRESLTIKCKVYEWMANTVM